MQFYKLVRIIDGSKWSFIETQWSVEYIPNEWTHPQIGKLFVWDDTAVGLSYLKTSYSLLELWRCEVVNPEEIKFYCDSFVNGDILDFWQNGTAFRVEYNDRLAYYVDAVKLVERIA